MRALFALLAAATVLLAPQGASQEAPSAILAAAPFCHAGAGPVAPLAAPERAPGLVDGLGEAGFAPERASPEAQRYFAEGARLYHAFNAPEAIRAFAWARKVDPACAMCAWGEAWARGPTINYPVTGAAVRPARAAAVAAAAGVQGLSPEAQGLVLATLAHYPLRLGQPLVDGAAYAGAMETLARRFPASDPIAVEAASALLIASGQAWADLRDHAPNARTRRARALLESVLERSPRYPPAIHFYIHLTEWLGEAKAGEPYADTLGGLTPAAGHLVHMPSHLYYRLGRYQDAATANARAAAADRAYVGALHPPGGLPAFALHAHNLSFGLGGALMSGDGPAALAFARDLRATFGEGCGACVRAWFALARYAPPDEVLTIKAPAASGDQAVAWRYARGEALARRGDAAGVAAEAQAAAALKPGDRDLAEIARLMLQGRAALIAGRPADAVIPLRRAAELRDRIDATPDPPQWAFPPRRTLGAALLLAGDAAGAARELTASLKIEPEDGLALFALSQAQGRLHRPEAKATLAAARRAWRGEAGAFRLELV